jgi:hypothetical protein
MVASFNPCVAWKHSAEKIAVSIEFNLQIFMPSENAAFFGPQSVSAGVEVAANRSRKFLPNLIF